ncbi:hypothetical protein NEOLI_001790 [Neolecta irregularis DAH-3]|uniref:Uncharacterized protein n=1 Tax=Neolecta irregularis (strain DAH-3) TaxID=1198029 RepID=A0A1U7LH74_NEOID|nr:hypothetical protein NEOLI_001790 [Neolecta irregularis DAH-3]|eukprot:OLL21978.1 hypothetical protein NEOLI_001790 [Neolecta irregularis DAH-3]
MKAVCPLKNIISSRKSKVSYNPKPLQSKSMLLDPTVVYPSPRPSKGLAPKFHGNKEGLTPAEERLVLNPFAHLISSPIRRDVFSQQLLPSALLQRFQVIRNADTNKLWILPDGLHSSMDKPTGLGRWIQPKKDIISFLGKGQYKRAIPQDLNSRVIWREDMPDYILNLLRLKLFSILETEPSWLRNVKSDDEIIKQTKHNFHFLLDWTENIPYTWDEFQVDDQNVTLIFSMWNLLGRDMIEKCKERKAMDNVELTVLDTSGSAAKRLFTILWKLCGYISKV